MEKDQTWKSPTFVKIGSRSSIR